jgi:hypothetical protein
MSHLSLREPAFRNDLLTEVSVISPTEFYERLVSRRQSKLFRKSFEGVTEYFVPGHRLARDN